MKSEKKSLNKIKDIFMNNKRENTDMIFRNSFAVACYLSVKGEKRAAKKLLNSIFDYVGWNRNTEYFKGIIDSLDVYANEYADEIDANVPINEIFEK